MAMVTTNKFNYFSYYSFKGHSLFGPWAPSQGASALMDARLQAKHEETLGLEEVPAQRKCPYRYHGP